MTTEQWRGEFNEGKTEYSGKPYRIALSFTTNTISAGLGQDLGLHCKKSLEIYVKRVTIL